jgi:hypothetical protein
MPIFGRRKPVKIPKVFPKVQADLGVREDLDPLVEAVLVTSGIAVEAIRSGSAAFGVQLSVDRSAGSAANLISECTFYALHLADRLIVARYGAPVRDELFEYLEPLVAAHVTDSLTINATAPSETVGSEHAGKMYESSMRSWRDAEAEYAQAAGIGIGAGEYKDGTVLWIFADRLAGGLEVSNNELWRTIVLKAATEGALGGNISETVSSLPQ